MKIFFYSVLLLFFISCTSKPGSASNDPERTGTKKSGISAGPEADGEALYLQHCAVCHSADGSGKEGLYPPLTATEYVTGNKSRLIGIVLHGMTGELQIEDKTYNSVMASFSYLKDNQIAAILTWIRAGFGKGAGEITPEDVKNER